MVFVPTRLQNTTVTCDFVDLCHSAKEVFLSCCSLLISVLRMPCIVRIGPLSKGMAREMEETERIIGQIMKQEREQCGLTQEALAQRLGVEEELVNRIESGVRPLELGEFFDWTKALGVDNATVFARIAQEVMN